jgi:DNA polymerase
MALGVTALQSMAGKAMPVGRRRGGIVMLGGIDVLPAVHPSYLLPFPNEDAKARDYAHFVAGPDAGPLEPVPDLS